MPTARLLVEAAGLEAQFRLIPDDDEEEEGQIEDEEEDDDDEEEEEVEENEDETTSDSNSNEAHQQQQQENENNNEHKSKDKQPRKESRKKLARISLFEMQSFLIALILPEPRLSTPPTWCRVLRCMRASNVGIFLLDDVDLDWIPDKGSKFTHAFRFESTPNWIEKLVSVPLSRRLQNETIPSEYSTGNRRFESDLNAHPKISRTALLLSPLQMIVESYPMPMDAGISMLRSKYKPVDDYAPIFAIDCEMCITDRSELTKISIVDEELRVVYNELVQPTQPITNYLTRYSGITKSMMEGVTLTIDDVHTFMRNNLPRNAIFCGHSLNMDLSAIEIFHPYVIDTSVIYNRTGIRSYKPSLKSLAYELLGKNIQSADKLGHDSLEDAITAMELVKLKMVNGILFGDSVAYEAANGIKYDHKTGITHLQIDKFIDRHKVTPISYRYIDTTPGARCLYIHDKPEPLSQEVKDAILLLLEKKNAICVVLTSSNECYVKF